MFNSPNNLPENMKTLNKKDLLNAVHDRAIEQVDGIIRGLFTPRSRHEEL